MISQFTPNFKNEKSHTSPRMKTILFILLCFLSTLCFSQNTYVTVDGYDNLNKKQRDSLANHGFKKILNSVNIKYNCPVGYRSYPLAFETPTLACYPKEAFLSSFRKILANYDNSILIGIIISDTTGHYELSKHISVDIDDNWKRILKSTADTTSTPIHYYDSYYLKKKANADDGAQYQLRCTKLYKLTYRVYKAVILHKKNRGSIQVLYLTKDRAAKEMDNIIKSTAGMLKYL